jgi:hypothetical protein
MEDWREDIEALEGAYPYSPDVDLPAVAGRSTAAIS